MSIGTPKRPTPKEIKSIFPSAIAVGIILPALGQGLHIEFGHCAANLFQELGISPSVRTFFSRKLFLLSEMYGFVNLKHCYVPEIDNPGGLSHGKNRTGQLLQDPFHRDALAGRPDFMTIIHRQMMKGKVTDIGRSEETHYALEDDVRTAIGELPTDGLSADVIRALSEMERPDYHFRLYDQDEMSARLVVQQQYPEFVDDILKLIPPERRFSKKWLGGIWDMVAHSNQTGKFLHARATGHVMDQNETRGNPLGGLEIYRG